MKIISNIKDTLVGSFTMQPATPELTIADEVALKNIIEIAKERIWLADPINTVEYDDDKFDDHLSAETIKRIKSSINVMETYLLKNSTKE
ncbi:MAG: hypothetical protein CBC02_009770 [Flavobacteriaceae bacterium TMED42]|nr:MAG: hypothetical protein CBC02_009770 [Flavobacteriaceae bacterium TMED42]|tara:strand:- start:1618 stop:1887 length:270 start_codon:yes stop_codon:yes gene_type:complete